jgi:predicted nucleic acid-binding protein
VIAYLDSSVLLRQVLRQPNRLKEWSRVETGVASAVVEVECLRTLDRLRLRVGMSDEELADRLEVVHRLMDKLTLIEPVEAVLRRAAQPLPTPLGTLNAIHLSTAILWRELRGEELVMATHDQALATAARASGLRVIGV